MTDNITNRSANLSYFNRYDLIIISNGICVLRDSDRQPRNLYRNYFFQETIKKFQNGSWMEDVEYIKSHFSLSNWKRNQAEKNLKLKPIADNLHLDPFN